MSDFVTLESNCILETRINSLSICEGVKFFGRKTVRILWEEESTSSGGRSIRSFGGSPRVADQQSQGISLKDIKNQDTSSCDN